MSLSASVNVDLDEIGCYAAIHGLSQTAEAYARGRNAVYDRGLPRLLEVFEYLQIKATFFVIGRDLDRPANQRAIKQASDAGHEIANHSEHHFYDLSRKDRVTMFAEVASTHQRIKALTGQDPVGFRAPGYTLSDELVSVIAGSDYLYDSSVFSSPLYFSAKSAAIAWIALRGRQSRSIRDNVRVLTAPTQPYRVGTPYWTQGSGLLEIPIGVTPRNLGQLPFIGTTVVSLPPLGARLLAKSMSGVPFVNLELHGIDLVDAESDDVLWLKPHQPDLRKSAYEKRASLLSALVELKGQGREFCRLDQIAQSSLAQT